MPFLLASCPVGSIYSCIIFWWNVLCAAVKNIHFDLRRASLSQRWILTNLRLPFKRLYNIYPPNKVDHIAQSPSKQPCFLSSSCSLSSQCSHSQSFKAKKLYILSLLHLNAWNKPWSPLLLSQVLLRTLYRDIMLCKLSGFGGLRQRERQLLLWERCRKTNQLSGLKSWAINSSCNYPEQNFVNICKLHPIFAWRVATHEGDLPRSEGCHLREFWRSRVQEIISKYLLN